MKHSLRKTLAAGALALIACSASWAAGPLPQSGKGMTIYFDVGGAVGESYATVVQNGAAQAAADMGVNVKFVYSDWNPQTMLENFKKSMAAKPDGIVVMGHPGDDAYAKLVDEAESKGIIVTATDTELAKLQATYQSKGFGYSGVENKARGVALASEALRRFKFAKGDEALVWGLKSQPTRGLSTVGIIETLEKAGLKVADLDGIGAEAGFHHIVRAAELADRRPRTGTVTALAEVPTFRRLAGRIAHGGVRADIVAAAQIIDARFDDEGHLADARIEADVLFFQILHDASRGIEAKGTAAAEQDGVDARRSRHRTEQFRFPAGRAAAADVDSTGRTFREHEDRAARAALAVLGIAQAETVRPGHG